MLLELQAAEAAQRVDKAQAEELTAKLALVEAALRQEASKGASSDQTKHVQLLEQCLKVKR